MLPSQRLKADSIQFWVCFYLQLFFFNNYAPFMLLPAVHDVFKPIFDHGSVIPGITADHWHAEIFASVVNAGNRDHEILLLISHWKDEGRKK
jgi:hypothetical protein